MDKEHITRVLERLEAERFIHDEKFATSSLHRNCLSRFDKVIASLKSNLAEDHQKRLDFATSESALPDAISFASTLMDTAQEMALQQEHDAAEMMHAKAVEVVMKELNELDGFAA